MLNCTPKHLIKNLSRQQVKNKLYEKANTKVIMNILNVTKLFTTGNIYMSKYKKACQIQKDIIY